VPVVIVVETDAAHAEALSDCLIELGASSVEIEDASAGTPEERPLFGEPGADSASWSRFRLRLMAQNEPSAKSLLAQSCAEIGLPVPGIITVEKLEDLDWVRSTQAQFPPIRVSARLWIVPSWERPPDPQAVNVILDPGRAFGTGSHPTTLLCLEWLDREVRGGETVLDYGCGSGILSIAACKLGAARVLGVDIDQQAIETARDNADRNGARCEFRHADAPLEIQADIVVANILANPLTLLAPAIAAFTRARGRLALAGVLANQFDDVANAYCPWFEVEPAAEMQGWVRVSATRRTAP
jgi:ribosomal protein L11 methyltransferase